MPYARLFLIVLLVSALAACARPTGDFGRVKAGTFSDETALRSIHSRERVAGANLWSFNRSDEEKDMENRILRFFSAIHSGDWAYHSDMQTAERLHRTGKPYTLDPARYYTYLQATNYRSSAVRYHNEAREIDADLATLPTAFESVCKVIEVDRRRAIAASSFGELDEVTRKQVERRKWENQQTIAWFAIVLSYRYDSYSYALKRLLVETPDEEARSVDDRLSKLAVWVERGDRHDFCTQQVLGQPAIRLEPRY